ncbi:MAG: cytochrome c biogenesis protein CcsA [Bacteroidetes bacterium]|nr:cytochrome c biogenesis protein CcsA [Bacteroidota bacterium]
MRQIWWKILCSLLLIYTVAYGMITEVPALHTLHETIRNLFYHVPMWFTMIFLLLISMIYSIKFLKTKDLKYDIYASSIAHVGCFFGVLGFVTGMLWGQYTWGSPLPQDPKIIGAAIAILIYFAYFILRASVNDEEKKAHLAAAFNVFAFIMLLIFTGVYPRMVDSLHPGNGGNPGFNVYDRDSRLSAVFYSAVAGWILLGLWISTIRIRISLLKKDNSI